MISSCKNWTRDCLWTLTVIAAVILLWSGVLSEAQESNVAGPGMAMSRKTLLIWEYDFGTTELSLRSESNPKGIWMPNDQTWQNPMQGYEDFAAKTCSTSDVTSGICDIPGGTFDINPNDPTMNGISPFLRRDGALTIEAFRTTASLYSAIQAELVAQGVKGPVPSFVGGRLMTNPEAFPGFTYGYFEFCVAFPNGGAGMFPALWFYATPKSKANVGKENAEIDLLEYLGHSNHFYTTVHFWDEGARAKRDLAQQVGSHAGVIDGLFHTYALDWTPDHLDIYFDRRRIYSASDVAVKWFRGVSLSPVMDYVIGAPWMITNAELRPNSATPDPLMMQVRYVRLYSRRPF